MAAALPNTSIVTAQQDEPLDHLAWRVTGSDTALAEIMAANPNLTATHLPEGTEVIVPIRPAKSQMRETIQLWSE